MAVSPLEAVPILWMLKPSFTLSNHLFSPVSIAPATCRSMPMVYMSTLFSQYTHFLSEYTFISGHIEHEMCLLNL